MKKYIFILIGLGVILLPRISFGATIDNFDTYSAGDLNGQGGWGGTASGLVNVVASTTVVSSPNMVEITGTSGGTYQEKSVSVPDGTNVDFWVYDLGINGTQEYYVKNGTGFGNILTQINVAASGDIHVVNGATVFTDIGVIPLDTWVKINLNGAWTSSGAFTITVDTLGSFNFNTLNGNIGAFNEFDIAPGGTGVVEEYMDGDGTPPPSSSSTLAFLYPTNNTITAPFSNFVMWGNNLTSTDIYSIQAQYYVPSVTGVQYTQSVNLTGAQIYNYGVALPVQPFNVSFNGTSATVLASANLYDLTNFQVPDSLTAFLVASTSIEYHLLPNGGQYGTSSYLLSTAFGAGTSTTYVLVNTVNPLSPIVASSSYFCTAPSNITDIGGGIAYGLCAAGQLLFVPSTNYTQGISSAITSFQNVFPFSLVFGVGNSVASGTTSEGSNGSLPLTILGLHGYYTLGTINSSTDINAFTTPVINDAIASVGACNVSCATEKVNNMFTVFDMLIWLTAALTIVRMTIHIL